MPQLIKNGKLVADGWTLVRDVAESTAAESPAQLTAQLPQSPPAHAIVPLAFWLAANDALRARRDVGVWLAPAADPALLAADAARLPLIAVEFPKFTDGRGYSTGRLLRERFGFTGELRAIGDIQRDQLYYLHQVGFDAFVVADGNDVQSVLAALRDFSDGYQLTNRRTPWFRRSGTDEPGRSRGVLE
jgi:uncharacterized protein (DUF934 family)